MRLAVYTDYEYHRVGGAVFAERAFALFIARIGRGFERLTVLGRLDPSPGSARYPLGDEVDFVALPFYESLAHPLQVARAALGMVGRFWRTLDDVDVVWMLGPHPFANLFALLARLRRKRVVLGVRQDTLAYFKARHPSRRSLHALAWALEAGFRLLARSMPVVAVGPQIAERYRHASDLLEISVSLVDDADLIDPADAAGKDYSGELTLLSVGRLEAEKNPLLMAEVLAALRGAGRRWRLVVCGEGPMGDDLQRRIERLGLSGSFELRGYVALHDGLLEIYRDSHALLHVSLTEGLPQVLLESFAAGLPVVATDVGGIAGAVGSAALMVQPGDPGAAAERVAEIEDEPDLRRHLIERGHDYVAARTVESETRRVAEFIAGVGAGERRGADRVRG